MALPAGLTPCRPGEAEALAAAAAARSLDALEWGQLEAERILAAHREATERLLADQRRALAEHRSALEEVLQRDGLAPPQGMASSAGGERARATRPPGQGGSSGAAARPHGRGAGAAVSAKAAPLSDGESGTEASSAWSPLVSIRQGWAGPSTGKAGAGVQAGTGMQRLPSQARRVEARNRLQEWLLPCMENPLVQSILGLMVVLNTIFFGYQVHLNIRQVLHSEESPVSSEIVAHMKLFFLTVFCVEVTFRLLAEQRDFFCGPHWKWNVFDCVIVGVCLWDEISSGKGGGIGVLRAMRMLRAVRIMRVFRFLRNLRMMLYSIMSCLMSIFWALLLLALIMYAFSIYLCQMVLYHKEVEGLEDSILNMLKTNWDGIPQSMRSLTYSISGGADWSDLAEPFWKMNVTDGLMYMLFILFTIFGLLNVMVGVFVQEAAEILKWDRELVLQDALEKEESKLLILQELFEELDPDGSGTLSVDEICQGMEDPHTKAFFKHLNIDMTNATEFFGALDREQNGFISMQDFITGCMRFQGSAKPLEVASLLTESRALTLKVDALGLRLDRIAEGRSL